DRSGHQKYGDRRLSQIRTPRHSAPPGPIWAVTKTIAKMPGKDPGFRNLAWLTRGVGYRPFSGGAKNPGAPARERNSSIKNPGRSPAGSDGIVRVHSRQSISTIGAPP